MAQQSTIGILLPYLYGSYELDVLTSARAVARQCGARLLAVWGTPRDISASSLARDDIDGWIAMLTISKSSWWRWSRTIWSTRDEH